MFFISGLHRGHLEVDVTRKLARVRNNVHVYLEEGT